MRTMKTTASTTTLSTRTKRTLISLHKRGFSYPEIAKRMNKMKFKTVRGAKWKALNTRYHLDKLGRIH